MNDNLAHTTLNSSIEILDLKIMNSLHDNLQGNLYRYSNPFNAISILKKREFIRSQDILAYDVERIEKPQLRIAHKSDILKQREAKNIVKEYADLAIIASSISTSTKMVSAYLQESQNSREFQDSLSILMNNFSAIIPFSVQNIDEDEERIEGDIKFLAQNNAAMLPLLSNIDDLENDKEEKEEQSASAKNNISSFKELRKNSNKLFTKRTPNKAHHISDRIVSYSSQKLEDMEESPFLAWLKEKDVHRAESSKEENVEDNTIKEEDNNIKLKDKKDKKPKKKKASSLKKKKKSKKLKAKSSQNFDELSEEIVSETLANLLAYHGHNDKAIEMYQKLILVKPKKSAYFASRIKELSENE